MSNYFFFRSPETIIYGPNSFERVGLEAAARGKKALIVSDQVMQSLGNVSECQRYLQEHDVQSAVYLGVHAEPTDAFVAEACKLYTDEQCDLIISLGGGSCIDTAKAVSVLMKNDGYIGEYAGGKKMAVGGCVPHIVIPTTAGTGSEASDVTVIINLATDEKMMIKQPAFMPAVAIVDPLLSHSSPPGVTAATGVDALTHAIEAYLSKKAHAMTDTLALSAAELIFHNILKAYQNPNDAAARAAMSLGSMQAGMAFSNASVALVHGMSRPIGAIFHVPHGISNAMLLPAVLEFSRDHCVERLAVLGRLFSPATSFASDDAAADAAIDAVRQLCFELKIPNLKNYGIDASLFKGVSEKMSADALKSGSPANNPRVPSADEIKMLYEVCYNYDFNKG